MATIYDVAELAGVSPKTVSRVLNDEPYVRDKLRRRVLQAMEELEYRPKFSARQMRTQKSEAIALITDEIAITPYAVGIIHGAFKEAWNHHKLLLIVNSERDAEIEKDFIKMMLERQVEGIIYATMAHRQAVLPQALQEIPTVLVNCFDADRSLFSVVPDEVQGGYTATKLLLTKGHRRVGFINDPDENPGAGGRLQGYKEALQEFAIPFDPDLYAQAAAFGESTFGYEGARQMLSLPDRPTALFCFNDRMAAEAYRAVHEMNLSIPDDVAIVGFDNQKALCEYLNPPMTTLQLPHYEMGQRAVQQLLKIIDEGDKTSPTRTTQEKLTCTLVERASA